MSYWPPSSPESCNSPFFYGLGDKGADKKTGWDREQARTICTEFFSVTRSLGGERSSFIMQAAPGNSWQVPNDALPVGRLLGHSSQTSAAALSSVPLRPAPKARSQQTYGSHSGLTPFLPVSEERWRQGIYNSPKWSVLFSFGLFQVWGPVKSFVTT